MTTDNSKICSSDDFFQLREEMDKETGFNKIKPALSFQQFFFGLFGTAVFMRSPNGALNTIAFTNIPNYELDSQENEYNDFDETEYKIDDEDDSQDDDSQDAQDFFDELDELPFPESDIDFGENGAEEFGQISESFIKNLAPCFELEKKPRFFNNFNELLEFVPMEVAARLQGYRLLIVPIRKHATYKKAANKKADCLVICYAHDDTENLKEEHIDDIERVWATYYYISQMKK